MTENNTSMWDMSSMNGNGVAIIIDEDDIVDFDSRVLSAPSIYCTSESDLSRHKGLMDEMYNHYANEMLFTCSDKVDPSIQQIGRSWSLLHAMASRIKHTLTNLRVNID